MNFLSLVYNFRVEDAVRATEKQNKTITNNKQVKPSGIVVAVENAICQASGNPQTEARSLDLGVLVNGDRRKCKLE